MTASDPILAARQPTTDVRSTDHAILTAHILSLIFRLSISYSSGNHLLDAVCSCHRRVSLSSYSFAPIP